LDLNFFVNNFQLFLLILARILAAVTVSPIFSSMLIPARVRALISFFVAIIIFLPVKEHYSANNFVMPQEFANYLLLMANEIMVGLAIGFFIGIIFVVFQMAAQFFSMQIGFGISEVIDPLSQIQIPIIGQLQALLGTLIFFAIDGHLQLFTALLQSFKHLPLVNMMNMTSDFFKAIKWAFIVMFTTALKIAFPVMGTLFLATLSMGLLAKAAPQMNILMVGFPIYITVGFLTIIYLLPGFLIKSKDILGEAFVMLYRFFGAG